MQVVLVRPFVRVSEPPTTLRLPRFYRFATSGHHTMAADAKKNYNEKK